MHKATGYKQDQMEQSAEDALLCAQRSTWCPEELNGLFWKTHSRHEVNSIPELMGNSNSGIAYLKKMEFELIKFEFELINLMWNWPSGIGIDKMELTPCLFIDHILFIYN